MAVSLFFGVNTAFADHNEENVSIGSAGREEDRCFKTTCLDPKTVTVHQGGTVVWSNVDTLAHTATSGTQRDGPDGKFDTGLLQPGDFSEIKFDVAGDYPYFCMVHPWTTGNVVVIIDQSSDNEEHEDESTGIPPEIPTEDTPPSGIDWEEKYFDVLADFNDISVKVVELQTENLDLKEKISELEETIMKLNAVLMEQVKVIYDWILSR